MALNDEELTFIRHMIGEPNSDGGWTDDRIQEVAQAGLLGSGAYDLRAVAGSIWEAKAAEAVDMVDVSESGSSRSMGQVHAHALKMAERYRAPAGGGVGTGGRTRTRRIVRE